MNENQVLCACNAYDEKYFFNDRFASIPEGIKEDLQIMCVRLTAEVGGIFIMEYDEEGNLFLSTTAPEEDLLYDEIGAHLKVKNLRMEQEELLEGLELYYKSFFLQ